MDVLLVILVWPMRRRWPALIVGVVAVALIGLSRLYLGVHYPSDVLGAWAALACVVGLRLGLAAPRLRRRRQGIQTVTGGRTTAALRVGDAP